MIPLSTITFNLWKRWGWIPRIIAIFALLIIILLTAWKCDSVRKEWQIENQKEAQAQKDIDRINNEKAELQRQLKASKEAEEKAKADAATLAEMVKKPSSDYKGSGLDAFCRVYFCSFQVLQPECSEWKKAQGSAVKCE